MFDAGWTARIAAPATKGLSNVCPKQVPNCYAEPMLIRLIWAVLLVASATWAQELAGRWDGTVAYADLRVPFRIHFEGHGSEMIGTFINGDTHVRSTSGTFTNGRLQLSFDNASTRLTATIADGELKGEYGGPKQGMNSITANAFCSCGFEGEAGPDISGTWEVKDLQLSLSIQRKGEDTFATLSRADGTLGPLAGRSDGLAFTLHYFDGERAAVLEIEPRKDGNLDVVLKEPGERPKKGMAIKTSKT